MTASGRLLATPRPPRNSTLKVLPFLLLAGLATPSAPGVGRRTDIHLLRVLQFALPGIALIQAKPIPSIAQIGKRRLLKQKNARVNFPHI